MSKRPRCLASNGGNGGYSGLLPYTLYRTLVRGLMFFNNSKGKIDFATFQPSYILARAVSNGRTLSYKTCQLEDPKQPSSTYHKRQLENPTTKLNLS